MMRAKPLVHLKTPIGIAGLGISGQSALRLLLESGFSRTEIRTFDKSITADFSDPMAFALSGIKTMLVSPGISLESEWILSFTKSGGLLESELSIASMFLTTEKVIGITGSVGKSTCTSLLGEGLLSFDINGFFGGNLGRPLADYAFRVLTGNTRAQWVVLELSSYQLENFHNLKADVSGIVSLTPNHLERYRDINHYYLTKKSLLQRTRNQCACNRNGGDLFPWLIANTDASEKAKIVWTDRNDGSLTEKLISETKLLGLHNLDNLALSLKIATLTGWPEIAHHSMIRFPGLKHRLENIGNVDGVLYVNDSKATTIQSVLTAVSSIKESVTGEIHLLLGGKDKKLPWHELFLLQNQNLSFYFFGQCGELAKSQSKLPGPVVEKMSEAFALAKKQAQPGDMILLSPGGTSLDEFKSFEHRGDEFKKLVNL